MLYNHRYWFAKQQTWTLEDETEKSLVSKANLSKNYSGNIIFNGTNIVAGVGYASELTGIGIIDNAYNVSELATTYKNYFKCYYDGTYMAFLAGIDRGSSVTSVIRINPSTLAKINSELYNENGEAIRGIIKQTNDTKYIIFDRVPWSAPDNNYFWFADVTANSLTGDTINSEMDKLYCHVNNSYNCYTATKYFLTDTQQAYYYPCYQSGLTRTSLERPFDNVNYFGGTVINGKAWYITFNNYIVAYNVSTYTYEYWDISHLGIGSLLEKANQSKIDNSIYFGTLNTGNYLYYMNPTEKKFVRVEKPATNIVCNFFVKAFSDKTFGIATNGYIYAIE